MTNHIEALLAKQAIQELVIRYARGIDLLDEPLLRSLVHPELTHNHFYQGPSSDPARCAMTLVTSFDLPFRF